MNERIANGNVPYVLAISYIDDYYRLKEMLESKNVNATSAFDHWHNKVFGQESEAMMRKRIG